MTQDYDNPWKDALEEHFRPFVEFFLPWVAGDIDWEQAPVSLEQELRKAHPEAATGKRLVDRLMRLFERGGDLRYLHIEVQGWYEADLPHRVWVYNKKATDHTGQEVVSIVLFVDNTPNWRPNRYDYELWRCKKSFEYPVVKLTDFQGREAELASHANPFALFVLGHLWSQATASDMEQRLERKLQLISLLLERKLDDTDLGSWRRLFDWQLQLPPEGEARVMEWLKQKRREGVMPFVSSFEKLAREEGRNEGRNEGLLRGALTGLKVKFGVAGTALEPRLAKADAALLEAVLNAIEADKPFVDIERLLPTAE